MTEAEDFVEMRNPCFLKKRWVHWSSAIRFGREWAMTELSSQYPTDGVSVSHVHGGGVVYI